MDRSMKRPLTKTEKTIRRFKRMRKNKKARFLGTMINPSRFHVSQLKFLLILVPMLTVTPTPLAFTTRSLPRAAASPMRGRLLRSRSPPQPKTVTSAPVVSGRSASSRRSR